MLNRRQLMTLPLALPLTGALQAQPAAWPNRPLHLIVPLPPGGAPDAAARTLGQAISVLLGQPVIVENRPGATTTIGSEFVARSAPDGYTLLMTATGAPALFPAIMKLRYDAIKDLPPLSLVARSEPVLLSGTGRKFGSMADFIAYAKANPQKASIGSIGIGTTNHLLCERIKRAAGIDPVYVPFQGAPPALQAAIGGDLDLLCLDVGGIVGLLGSGRITPLAVASATRSSFLPDTPTLAEAGIPGLVSANHYAVFLPAGVPADISAKLQATLAKAVDSAETRQAFEKLGLIAQSSTPEELSQLIRQDAAVLVPLAKALNIRLD